MKKIILSAALTAVLASPAFAQATPMLTQPQAYSSQRIQPGHYAQQRGYVRQGYVQEPAYGSSVVVNGGEIVGQDPDPNVRLELRRDPVADY
jgi:hypothetical protein